METLINVTYDENTKQPVVSSLQIAENFEKQHAKVIRAIEQHISDLKSTNPKVAWFYETAYTDKKGETRKMYLMNRDGFSLLVMSFNNTKQVLEWKLKYIQAFNDMEKQLQKPKSMEDILIYQLQEMKRLKEQSEQATAIATEAKETANGIRDIVAIQVTDWRKDTNSILNKIAVSLGGGDSYKMVKEEAYKTLQDKIHVDLHRRLTNLKSRMALEGVAKSTINKNSILDVIERDRKVLECYISVVKNMAIKYGVDLPSEMKAGDHA